ncbi:MAG: hypothetical protein Q9188_005195, partial [Gyalolechia gomerana]
MALTGLAFHQEPDWGTAYTAVMTLETLGLPDGDVDCVHTIADAGNHTRDDHLNAFGGGSLQDGTDNHDPAANVDTAFPAKTIGGHESEDGTSETAQIVDARNDTFHIGVGVVEIMTEGTQTDNRS